MIRIRIRGTRSAGGLDGRRWTQYEMRGARRDNAVRAMEEKRNETNERTKARREGADGDEEQRHSQQVKPPAFPHSRNSQYSPRALCATTEKRELAHRIPFYSTTGHGISPWHHSPVYAQRRRVWARGVRGGACPGLAGGRRGRVRGRGARRVVVGA